MGCISYGVLACIFRLRIQTSPSILVRPLLCPRQPLLVSHSHSRSLPARRVKNKPVLPIIISFFLKRGSRLSDGI